MLKKKKKGNNSNNSNTNTPLDLPIKDKKLKKKKNPKLPKEKGLGFKKTKTKTPKDKKKSKELNIPFLNRKTKDKPIKQPTKKGGFRKQKTNDILQNNNIGDENGYINDNKKESFLNKNIKNPFKKSTVEVVNETRTYDLEYQHHPTTTQKKRGLQRLLPSRKPASSRNNVNYTMPQYIVLTESLQAGIDYRNRHRQEQIDKSNRVETGQVLDNLINIPTVPLEPNNIDEVIMSDIELISLPEFEEEPQVEVQNDFILEELNDNEDIILEPTVEDIIIEEPTVEDIIIEDLVIEESEQEEFKEVDIIEPEELDLNINIDIDMDIDIDENMDIEENLNTPYPQPSIEDLMIEDDVIENIPHKNMEDDNSGIVDIDTIYNGIIENEEYKALLDTDEVDDDEDEDDDDYDFLNNSGNTGEGQELISKIYDISKGGNYLGK